MKKASSWEAVGISRIGLEMDPNAWIYVFRLINWISHFTCYSSRFFFFPVSLRTYEVSVQFPLCLVLSSVTATLFGGHTPRQFFVKSTPVLWTLGTLRLVLLHQVSLTWIDKCVKERKLIFQWLVCIHFSSFLESNDGMWSCSPGYGIWEVLSLVQRSPMM